MKTFIVKCIIIGVFIFLLLYSLQVSLPPEHLFYITFLMIFIYWLSFSTNDNFDYQSQYDQTNNEQYWNNRSSDKSCTATVLSWGIWSVFIFHGICFVFICVICPWNIKHAHIYLLLFQLLYFTRTAIHVIATKVKGNSCESVSQLDAATAHIVVICVLPLSGSNFDTYPDILYVDLIKWIKTNIVMSACLFTLQNQLSLNYQFPNSFFLTKYLGYRNERNILTGNYAVGMGLLLKRKVSPQLRFRSFNFQV